MFRVRFYSHWNGYSNQYDYKDFATLQEAQAFASSSYDATVYKRVPSRFANSKWEYVAI